MILIGEGRTDTNAGTLPNNNRNWAALELGDPDAIKEADVIRILESETDNIEIDILGQVTYEGSYKYAGEVSDSEYNEGTYSIPTNPGFIFNTSNQTVSFDNITISNNAGGSIYYTESFDIFTLNREASATLTLQNLISAFATNFSVDRDFSSASATGFDIDSEGLAPFYFDSASASSIKFSVSDDLLGSNGPFGNGLRFTLRDSNGSVRIQFVFFPLDGQRANILLTVTRVLISIMLEVHIRQFFNPLIGPKIPQLVKE